MDERTISYVIKDENFKYHFKKCTMKAKDCVISKNKHPVREVELLKAELLESGKLKESDGGYKLRHDFKTGPLMAYNLCSDILQKDLSEFQSGVVINGGVGEDVDLKEYFEIPNVVASDSIYAKQLRKYELKIVTIEECKFIEGFFDNHGTPDCSFSRNEQFVVNSLVASEELKNPRRGIAADGEADIVDEKSNRQVEIVTCFNEANNVIRYKEKMPMESIILDSVATGHYALPKGVMKKFYDKEYTGKYELELAILFIGSNKTVSEMLSMIKVKITNNLNIKNNFNAIHIIAVDPIKDLITCISPGRNKTIKIEDNPVKIYRKTSIDINQLQPNDNYLMTCKNIFDEHLEVAMLSGKEIRQIIKESKVWVEEKTDNV